MCCDFWEKCINSHKIGQGCSTPLIIVKKIKKKKERKGEKKIFGNITKLDKKLLIIIYKHIS